ncbi:MAG: hypothetical protein ACRDY3_06195 [Acidimicrobiales bacterium]
MTGFQICLLVLVVAALGPGLVLAGTGGAPRRLVGASLVASTATVVFLVMAQVAGQQYELILPLVMVGLSFAGVLVFTRLLASRTG